MIDDKEIKSSQGGTVFHVARSAAPGSMSSKSLITLSRVSGQPVGNVRFHSSTSSIDMNINGSFTKLKDDTTMSFQWYFHPTGFPDKKWYWKEKSGSFKLTDGKGSDIVLANLNGGTLIVENIGLPEPAVDEIVLSAVAVLAKKKKLGKEEAAAEGIGEVIGALAGG
jgi:hypothetical protein